MKLFELIYEQPGKFYRRLGQITSVRLTLDGWKDSDGVVWMPSVEAWFADDWDLVPKELPLHKRLELGDKVTTGGWKGLVTGINNVPSDARVSVNGSWLLNDTIDKDFKLL